MYNIIKKDFNDVIYFKSSCFSDNRGYFSISYNKIAFEKEIINQTFVQQNISKSALNVTRGLHYQIENPQAKLVSCLYGRIIDVIMDIRKSSPTFGQMKAYELNNPYTFLYIPIGFAHGFLTLSDYAIFQYFVSDYWNKNGERGINLLKSLKEREPLKLQTIYKHEKLFLNTTDLYLYILSDKDKLYPTLSSVLDKDLFYFK